MLFSLFPLCDFLNFPPTPLPVCMHDLSHSYYHVAKKILWSSVGMYARETEFLG